MSRHSQSEATKWGASLKELLDAQRVVPPSWWKWPECDFKRFVAPVYFGRYLGALREGYVEARRRNIMPHEQFVEAIKTDQAATLAWNRFIELKQEGAETVGSWKDVLQAVRTLEKVLVPRWRGKRSLLSVMNEVFGWNFNLEHLWTPILVRRCKKPGCAEVFFPKTPGQTYHSARCGTADRVARYRQRNPQS